MTPEEQNALKEAITKIACGMLTDPDEKLIEETAEVLTSNEAFMRLALASTESLVLLAGYDGAPTAEDALSRNPEELFAIGYGKVLAHIVSMLQLGIMFGSRLAALGIKLEDQP
jgi:hypothetical protein